MANDYNNALFTRGANQVCNVETNALRTTTILPLFGFSRKDYREGSSRAKLCYKEFGSVLRQRSA